MYIVSCHIAAEQIEERENTHTHDFPTPSGQSVFFFVSFLFLYFSHIAAHCLLQCQRCPQSRPAAAAAASIVNKSSTLLHYTVIDDRRDKNLIAIGYF